MTFPLLALAKVRLVPTNIRDFLWHCRSVGSEPGVQTKPAIMALSQLEPLWPSVLVTHCQKCGVLWSIVSKNKPFWSSVALSISQLHHFKKPMMQMWRRLQKRGLLLTLLIFYMCVFCWKRERKHLKNAARQQEAKNTVTCKSWFF